MLIQNRTNQKFEVCPQRSAKASRRLSQVLVFTLSMRKLEFISSGSEGN